MENYIILMFNTKSNVNAGSYFSYANTSPACIAMIMCSYQSLHFIPTIFGACVGGPFFLLWGTSSDQ